jgi:cyclophilin family peptidyl-prolyl cis-trans isomerase
METIRSEFTRRKFDAGVLGMASAGPDTESCQWFITHTRTPHLNGRYTAFGKVVKGMEIVHLLGYGAHIQNIVLAAP